MMRSMFAAVSGLRAHQTRMDVVGNNIANVNTVAYKKSRVTFQDMMSQTLRSATTPQGEKGGTNPLQVGLGMKMSSIDTIFTEGNTQTTDKVTDLAIEGNGFFILKAGDLYLYTRAGNFDLDVEGNLCNPANGYKVQGWKYNDDGTIDVSQPLEDVKVVFGQAIGGGTTRLEYMKNLNSSSATGEVFEVNTIVYDSQGNSYEIITRFEKLDQATDPNAWKMSVKAKDNSLEVDSLTPDADGFYEVGTIKFTNDGLWESLKDSSGSDVTGLQIIPSDSGRNPFTLKLSFDNLTQFNSETSVEGIAPDAHGAGRLYDFTIDRNGTVMGIYSNGVTKPLYKIALTNFNNPAGLVKVGDSFYQESTNSGKGVPAEANKGEYGAIVSGSLEMSNVDLSQEFTEMIITQRGFQANSRVITASDEMLQELVNLKR
ncbi:MAG TPA: flagellar hook protein FlgE [Clostridia bacterium]|nr:flagellar hook protein FlgE [Clostridia bacterium]